MPGNYRSLLRLHELPELAPHLGAGVVGAGWPETLQDLWNQGGV